MLAGRLRAVPVTEPAEHLVIDQMRDRRPLAADDALRIPPELQHADLARERLEVHHASDERRALPEDQLDRLERLHAADEAGQHTEHAGLGAGWDGAGRGRLREE